jgi:molecular chaperone DnaK (HSP70)
VVHPLETVGNLAGLYGAGFHDAQQRLLQALAGELGMTSRELHDATQAGKSVEELAAARGVALETLRAKAEAALGGAVPQAVAARVPAMVRRLLQAHHHGDVGAPLARVPGSTFNTRA